MLFAQFSDRVAPSAQNQLGFSHCLCPPTAEDEDAKRFPTLLPHQSHPGTAQPLPRLQCQAESFSPHKITAKGRSKHEGKPPSDPAWDLLTSPRASDKPAQGIRNLPSGSPGPAPAPALTPHLEWSCFGSPLPPEPGSGAARRGPVTTSDPTPRELQGRGGCWVVCAEPDFPPVFNLRFQHVQSSIRT